MQTDWSNGKVKNLLFIVPTLKRAGAETQVVTLVNGLDSKKYKIHLLMFGEDQSLRSTLNNAVEFHCVPRGGKLGITLARAIAELIDSDAIDFIHCTLQISLLYGLMGRYFAKRQPTVVCAIHTTINVSEKFEWADRLLYRKLLRRCDGIIFVCNNQRDYWLHRYPELASQSSVIYNGVDVAVFDPSRCVEQERALRKRLGLGRLTRSILCVAGFRPEKAHQLLIEAFREIVRERDDVFLLLAGDGPTRPRMEGLVRTIGVSDRVVFFGITDEIPALLAVADISVLASTAVETFSMAMLESMSMQTPVIATNIGGASEAVIHHETGILVEPGDSRLLRIALAELLDQDSLRETMGRQARVKVLNEFTDESMVTKTSSLIDAQVSSQEGNRTSG